MANHYMNPQLDDLTPFDPPYFTIFRTAKACHVEETLSDGTIRTVLHDQRFQLATPPASHSSNTPSALAKSAPATKAQAGPSTMGGLLFLNVPFSQKDQAKSVGAKWDAGKKKWYVPQGLDIDLFKAWWPDSLK